MHKSNIHMSYILSGLALLLAAGAFSGWFFRDRLSKENIDIIVAIATALTGIASIVVGFVSVHVMTTQNEMQKSLIEYQKKEHQPVFIVKKSIGKSTPDAEKYDYEEFTLENVGERFKSLQSVSQHNFVRFTYSNRGTQHPENIVSYAPITHYYNVQSGTSDVRDLIIQSYASDKILNHKRYTDLYFDAVEYSSSHENETLLVDRIEFFIITYTDIYDETKTIYLKGKETVEKEEYDNICAKAESDYGHRSYDLKELNLDIFFNDRRKAVGG